MTKQPCVAMLGALLLGFAHAAAAYSTGQFNTNLARCNTCHTGGDPPSAKFSPAQRAAQVGTRFQIAAGSSATLELEVKTLPGKGLGLAIVAGTGLSLESTRDDTQVDRQTLGHKRVLFEPTGRYRVPFRITAPQTSCGRTITLSANVAAVNRNGAPGGDGTAATATSVYIDCAPAAATTPSAASAEPPKVAVQPRDSIAASPTAPAITAPAGAARVMAPTGSITAPVRVSVDALRAPGGVAQLELTSVNRITTAAPPEAEFLDTGGGPPGSVSLHFNQAAGHVLIDCEVRSPGDMRFTIDAGSLHIENTVPAGDGHAVTVVPRGGIQRDVQVLLRGMGRKWSFRGCELTPVR